MLIQNLGPRRRLAADGPGGGATGGGVGGLLGGSAGWVDGRGTSGGGTGGRSGRDIVGITRVSSGRGWSPERGLLP